MNSKNVIFVIVGPTGSGKTDLGRRLLDHIDGEIVSADSRQVYRNLNYTTNKLSLDESTDQYDIQNGVWFVDGKRINLYDVIDITDTMSVGAYVDLAYEQVSRIISEGKTPIIVGGTGYYISALLGESAYGKIEQDDRLREELQNLSVGELYDRLHMIDPQAAENLNDSDSGNRQRLIRFIELATHAGSVEHAKHYSPLKDDIEINGIDIRKLGLSTDRMILYQKGDAWIDGLVHHPMFEKEIDLIAHEPHVSDVLSRGLIYQSALRQREGLISWDDMTQKMKYQIHQYIKRQLIWFKRDTSIEWVDIIDQQAIDRLVANIDSWYIN